MSSLQFPNYSNIPSSPGIYFFRDKRDKILYIGKAINLKRRVSSYFQKKIFDPRLSDLADKISKIDYQKTDSVIEALILEANLIKKYQPFYNVKLKDDKSFVNIVISKEEFPRVFIMRLNAKRLFNKLGLSALISRNYADLTQKNAEISKFLNDNLKIKKLFGPYPSANTARMALKILRRIFPFRGLEKTREGERFYQEILEIPENKKRYGKGIKNLMLFLSGKKKRIIGDLKKEMKQAAKSKDYEEAARLRDQIFALRHIQDVALIKEADWLEDLGPANAPARIEAYDISNIFGEYAVGSMAVFTDGKIDKDQYRRFRIKGLKIPLAPFAKGGTKSTPTLLCKRREELISPFEKGGLRGISDTAMLAEVLERRLKHIEWRFPDLIIIDGGLGQLNAVKKVLENRKFKIPLISIAKGAARKGEKLFTTTPNGEVYEYDKKWIKKKKVIQSGRAFKNKDLVWWFMTKNVYLDSKRMAPNLDRKIILAIRDEAHRFAIKYHRKLKRKGMRF